MTSKTRRRQQWRRGVTAWGETVLGNWVEKLLAERGASSEEFFANLERGLAKSKCSRCGYRTVKGCTQSYWTCDPRDKGVLFWERWR